MIIPEARLVFASSYLDGTAEKDGVAAYAQQLIRQQILTRVEHAEPMGSFTLKTPVPPGLDPSALASELTTLVDDPNRASVTFSVEAQALKEEPRMLVLTATHVYGIELAALRSATVLLQDAPAPAVPQVEAGQGQKGAATPAAPSWREAAAKRPTPKLDDRLWRHKFPAKASPDQVVEALVTNAVQPLLLGEGPRAFHIVLPRNVDLVQLSDALDTHCKNTDYVVTATAHRVRLERTIINFNVKNARDADVMT